MTPEKRQMIRKRVGRLLYAEIGADNGSILLDISEQGCSFQAIAPVREQQLHFTISVGAGRKVTGNARVAWVDATQKVGGLRFLNDSSELREQIRSWMEMTVAPESSLRAGEQPESEAKLRRKKLREDARAQLGSTGASRPAKSPASSGQALAASGAGTATRESVLISTQMPEKAVLAAPVRNPAGAGLATVAIGLVALFATMTVAYRQEIGHLVMRIGAGMTGEAPKPPAAPLDQGSVPSIPAETSVPATASGLGEIGPPNAIEPEALPGKKQLTPVSDGTVQAMPAVSRNADLTEDVPSLWTLVESGDTRAELTLADRYLRGEGVTQSCAQARVLLEAAAKRGNSEAQRKLDELPQAGCR
jgi:hypothetical protein